MPNSDQGTTVMNGPTDSTTARPWKEILTAFLKLGATSYGGPAMMGIMQAELQGKRKWVLEGALCRRTGGSEHGAGRDGDPARDLPSL